MTTGHDPQGQPEQDDILNLRAIRGAITFTLTAVRRNKAVLLAVFAASLAATSGALALWPRTYHVSTTILAQRNVVMHALGNPNRAVPSEADSPTRAVRETVFRRDTLLSLIKETDLLAVWKRTRSLPLRVKDWVVDLVRGPLTEDDEIDALIGLLEKRLCVSTGDSTVDISIGWPDAETAHRLVAGAERNFLEARHVAETAVVSEAIAILEAHADEVQTRIDATLAEIDDSVRQIGAPSAQKSSVRTAPRPSGPTRGSDSTQQQELARLRAARSAKAQTLRDLDDYRQRRLSELQVILTEQRAIYSADHPIVVNVKQSIAALEHESVQVTTLRKEISDLEQQIEKIGSTSASSSTPHVAFARFEPPRTPEPKADPKSALDEMTVDVLRSRLESSADYRASLLARIDAARIELDAARAAFKYRYSVIRPARMPKRPIRPKVPNVLAAGAVASLALGVAAAVLAELRARARQGVGDSAPEVQPDVRSLKEVREG